VLVEDVKISRNETLFQSMLNEVQNWGVEVAIGGRLSAIGFRVSGFGLK
jgi:hypothetical protein